VGYCLKWLTHRAQFCRQQSREGNSVISQNGGKFNFPCYVLVAEIIKPAPYYLRIVVTIGIK